MASPVDRTQQKTMGMYGPLLLSECMVIRDIYGSVVVNVWVGGKIQIRQMIAFNVPSWRSVTCIGIMKKTFYHIRADETASEMVAWQNGVVTFGVQHKTLYCNGTEPTVWLLCQKL
jgi:hypothetical protein